MLGIKVPKKSIKGSCFYGEGICNTTARRRGKWNFILDIIGSLLNSTGGSLGTVPAAAPRQELASLRCKAVTIEKKWLRLEAATQQQLVYMQSYSSHPWIVSFDIHYPRNRSRNSSTSTWIPGKSGNVSHTLHAILYLPYSLISPKINTETFLKDKRQICWEVGRGLTRNPIFQLGLEE